MSSFQFNEFIDKKTRKAKKHLSLIKKMLEQGGFQVTDKLDEREDPYIFVFNPNNNLSFDGVRVYEIGDEIAYRIQKEARTHPFGKAYPIPIEQMFEDLLGEDMDDSKIGKEIIKSVVNELKEFFDKSYQAEKKGPPKEDPLDKIHTRTTGTDYSNQVTDVQNR